MEAYVVLCSTSTTCAKPVCAWSAAAPRLRPSSVRSQSRVICPNRPLRSQFCSGSPLSHRVVRVTARNAKLPPPMLVRAHSSHAEPNSARHPRCNQAGVPTHRMPSLAGNVARWVGAASLTLCCALVGGLAAPPPAHARRVPTPTSAPRVHADRNTRCVQQYLVRNGDTLTIIANKLGVSLEALSAANGGVLDNIYVGQALEIPREPLPTTPAAPSRATSWDSFSLRRLMETLGVYRGDNSQEEEEASPCAAPIEPGPQAAHPNGAPAKMPTRQRSLMDKVLFGWQGKSAADLVYDDEDDKLQVTHSQWEVQRYRVQRMFESNPFANLWALFALTMLLWLVGTAAYARASPVPLHEAMYKAFAYLSQGAGSSLDDEEWGPPRAVSGGLFLIGLVVFASLTSVLGEMVENSMEKLREGKHPVLEQQHTLVLGWNDSVPQLVEGLVMGTSKVNQHQTVVVLADKDVEDMKSTMGEVLGAKSNRILDNRVVYRQGDPGSRFAQSWVASEAARSIVVMAGESESEDEVALQSLRTVLATKANYEKCKKDAKANNRAVPRAPRVVVQTTSADSPDDALIRMCADRNLFNVTSIPAGSLMKRHLAQCSVQPNGLAALTRQLLSLDNNHPSFFIERVPAVAGSTFGDVLSMFPDAAPCGLFVEKALFVPPPHYVMKKEDKLVLLATKKSEIRPVARPMVGPSTTGQATPVRLIRNQIPKRVLIINWFEGISDLLLLLDAILDPGSSVTVLADRPKERMHAELAAHGFRPSRLSNMDLRLVEGSPQSQEDLSRIDPASFASIILLCSGDVAGDGTVENGATADTHNLATLVRLRKIINESPNGANQAVMITVEVQASPTRKLVKSVYKTAQTVIGPRMTALLLAQASVSTDSFHLWRDLLDTNGMEIYHKPVEAYVGPGERISWHALVRRAYEQAGVMPFGYTDKNGEYKLNPRDKHMPIDFRQEAINLVVLSDN